MSNKNYESDLFLKDDENPNEITRIISNVSNNHAAAPSTDFKDEQHEALLLSQTLHTSNNVHPDTDDTGIVHQPIHILRPHPMYSTMNYTNNNLDDGASTGDSGGVMLKSNTSFTSTNHTTTSVDYETLLTLALENASQKVDLENKHKQSKMFGLTGVFILLSLFLLSTIAFSEYPEEKALHDQVKTLNQDINELDSEVNNFQRDEGIDVLNQDIDDKKEFIQQIQNDASIDTAEKTKLVKELQSEIDDLKIVVKKLKKEDEMEEKTGQIPKCVPENEESNTGTSSPP